VNYDVGTPGKFSNRPDRSHQHAAAIERNEEYRDRFRPLCNVASHSFGPEIKGPAPVCVR
jgi:hypothetical protein